MRVLIITFCLLSSYLCSQQADTISEPYVLFSQHGDKVLRMHPVFYSGIWVYDSTQFTIYQSDKPRPIDSVKIPVHAMDARLSDCPIELIAKYNLFYPGIAFEAMRYPGIRVEYTILDSTTRIHSISGKDTSFYDITIEYVLFLDDKLFVVDTVNRLETPSELHNPTYDLFDSFSLKPMGVIWKHPEFAIYFSDIEYIVEANRTRQNIIGRLVIDVIPKDIVRLINCQKQNDQKPNE